MVNMHSANYHVSPSGLTLGIHPFILFFAFFLQKFCCLKDCGEDFQMCGVPRTEKCVFLVKKFKEDIITYAPHAKSSPRFLSTSSRQKKINYSPSQSSIFFKNLLPPWAEREEEGHCYEGFNQP